MADNTAPPATNSPTQPIPPAGKPPSTNSPTPLIPPSGSPPAAGIVSPSTAIVIPPAGSPPASNSPPPAAGVVNPSTAIIIPPAGDPPASNSQPPAAGVANPSTAIIIPPAGDPPASNSPALAAGVANPSTAIDIPPAGHSQPPAAGGDNTDENEETPNTVVGQEDGTVISGGQGQTPAGVGAQVSGTARTVPYNNQALFLGSGKFQKWKLSEPRREILEGFEKLDEKLMQDAVEIEKTADKAVLMALGITSAIVTMTAFPAMVVIRIGGNILFSLMVSIPAASGLFFAFWRSKGKLDRLTRPIRKAVEDEDVIVRHGDLFFRDVVTTATAAGLRMRDLLPDDAKRMNKVRFRHSGLRNLQSTYLLFVWGFFLLGMLAVAYLCFGQYFGTAKEKITPAIPIAPMASPPPPPPSVFQEGMYFGGLLDILFGWDSGINYWCFRRGPC